MEKCNLFECNRIVIRAGAKYCCSQHRQLAYVREKRRQEGRLVLPVKTGVDSASSIALQAKETQQMPFKSVREMTFAEKLKAEEERWSFTRRWNGGRTKSSVGISSSYELCPDGCPQRLRAVWVMFRKKREHSDAP